MQDLVLIGLLTLFGQAAREVRDWRPAVRVSRAAMQTVKRRRQDEQRTASVCGVCGNLACKDHF